MGKYLKLFENHNQYTAFTQTEELMEKSLTGDIHWDNAQINHYVTKTIEEFIKYKAIRGVS